MVEEDEESVEDAVVEGELDVDTLEVGEDGQRRLQQVVRVHLQPHPERQQLADQQRPTRLPTQHRGVSSQ